jgi:hypothetical protein
MEIIKEVLDGEFCYRVFERMEEGELVWTCSIKGVNIQQLLDDYNNTEKMFEFNSERHIGFSNTIHHLELYSSPTREIVSDILDVVLTHKNCSYEEIVEMKIIPVKINQILEGMYFLVLRFVDKDLSFVPFDFSLLKKMGQEEFMEFSRIRKLERATRFKNGESNLEKNDDDIIEIDL